MRAMWSDERRGIRFDGRYYQLDGARAGPTPAHPIQVWIGANGPRALALTGRVADGWTSPLMNYKPPREAAQVNLVIDRADGEAGRDPREIRRIYNVPGSFTTTRQAPATDSDQAIVGPPEHWAETLTHFALDLGFSTFLLIAPADPGMLITFIEDIGPAVRDGWTSGEPRRSNGGRPGRVFVAGRVRGVRSVSGDGHTFPDWWTRGGAGGPAQRMRACSSG